MSVTLTIANRKGGVGKTTLAIALAETFVFEHRKNTVIVDLDPQSSASEILLSEDEYAQKIEQNSVLPGLWNRANRLSSTSISEVLSHARHSLVGRGQVDLAIAPNSPQLWDLEFDILRSGAEDSYREAVYNSLQELKDQFDVVIADCPPGKLIAAEEAILMSDLVICPIVPERLSVWGMDKMKEYFEELEQQHQVPPWKFVISRFTGNRKEAQRQIQHIEGTYKEHFMTESQGLFGLGEREFMGLDQTEAIIKRIAKFRDDPDDVKNLEGFYGRSVTQQLRRITKEIKSLGE